MANQTRLFGMTRLRYDSALHGYILPGSMVKLCIECAFLNKINIAGPIVFFAQGRSMPISRGSPPFYDD